MQDQTSVHGTPQLVSGLGLCDAWRLTLSAEQWPWLADELDRAGRRLDDELADRRNAHNADPTDETAEQVGTLEYERQLIELIVQQLPARTRDEVICFIGPADLL